ncbi:EAL domain-containing protein [Cyanobium sp. Morenito 9A2]|nr:EAL domain-containing protein [Cyanobium sp. Morenito 9A2]
MLHRVLEKLRHWNQPGRSPVVVAVNLSAQQLLQPDLVEHLEALLVQEGVHPSWLELELTESVTMHNPERVAQIMGELRELGITWSIDDFGTGYSSFSYLRKLRVNKLKIDQSFIGDLETSEDGRTIVRLIIHPAHNLGIKAIAEGVETEGQLAYLRQQGCDEIQGYLCSRPLQVEAFEAFMAAHNPSLWAPPPPASP